MGLGQSALWPSMLSLFLAPGVARGAGASSKCWSGHFTFASCCFGGPPDPFAVGGHALCWSEGFDYGSCCLTHPLLSEEDLKHIRRHARDAPAAAGIAAPEELACRPGGAVIAGPMDWHEVKAAMTLRAWSSVRPHWYAWGSEVDAEGLAACPLGAISLVLITLLLHNVVASDGRAKGGGGRWWLDHPAFLWSEEVLGAFRAEGGPNIWPRMLASGWPLADALRALGAQAWPSPHPFAGHACGPGGAGAALAGAGAGAGADDTEDLGAAIAVEVAGGLASASLGEAPPPCALDEAALTWSLARRLAEALSAPGGLVADRRSASVDGALVLRGASLVEAGLSAVERPLLLLAYFEGSGRELLTQLYRLQRTRPIALPLASMLGHGPGVRQTGAVARHLRAPFDRPEAFFTMRLLVTPEVISDGIRHALSPVCGMAPFIGLVVNMATAAAAAERPCPAGGARRCRLSVLEGGANLGGCLIWAASALKTVDGFLSSVALEPMLRAAELFELSVLEGGFAQNVHMERRALTAPGVTYSTLRYIPGRHGNAALEAHTHSGCPDGDVPQPDWCVDEAVEATTVDEAWTRRFGRAQQLDVLKLNVNGEELNALRGARSLLSRRGVCVVMMHVFKMQYAVRKELEVLHDGGQGRAVAMARVRRFSNEVFHLLGGEGRMEIFLHLEPPVKHFLLAEAVRVPLRSPGAMRRVLSAHHEDLGKVADALRVRAGQPRGLPFVADQLHQGFVVARVPRSVARCRYVAHEQLPAR